MKMRLAGTIVGLFVLLTFLVPGTYAPKRNRTSVTAQPFESGSPTMGRNDLGQATLEGRVFDEAGRPVGGASVALAGSGFWPARSVQTDQDGRFLWPEIPAGIYELRVSKDRWVAPTVEGLILDPGARRAFALRLGRGWNLTGRVLDAKNARPIANAEVTLMSGTLGLHVRRVSTDGEGRFELQGIEAREQSLYVEAEGYVSAGPLRYGEADSAATVRLEPAATIEGRIADERGLPIEGASVSAFGEREAPFAPPSADSLGVTAGPVPPIWAAGSGLRALTGRVDTRSDGSFRIANLPAGTYTIVSSHGDYAPAEAGPIDVGTGAARSGVEIVMQRGAELAGRVVDQAGRGLEAIPVELRSAEERLPRLSITAADGSFAFRGIRGEVTVTALPYELPPARQTVSIDDEALVTVELALSSTVRTLHGRLVDESGFGIEGALVTVSSNDPQTPIRRSTKSDVDGRFSVPALPDPPFALRAEHPMFSTVRLGEIERLEDVEVVMSAGVTFLGEVVDDWTGDALKNAAVELRGPIETVGRTRSDGTFVFNQLPTGTYTVIVTHPEFEAQMRRVVVESPRYVERPQTLETVRLEPGGTIRGEVIDLQSEPVSGAEVTWGQPPKWDRSVFTDALGKFELRGVPSGSVGLTARHPVAGESSSFESTTVRPRETSTGAFVRLPDSVR